MYLKKVEIQGFKSFADKIAIELGKGVTSIVGPNGSGKSNIADAVRWVLGEQSVKSLRGARMDDVIFSGTEHRKPSGFAEVTLLIDNADGGLRIPYSEVSVARRIYRSGESEYLINRSQCRLKDVNELFFDTGIGREGYSIIGQGKVDEILNNKPEDRRGIFEEAAGISKYKAKRHEAERKLFATSQNLVRIRDIIGELEAQLAVLSEQASVAREYLRLRDELKEIEVAGYVSSIGKHEKSLAKCESGLATAKEGQAAQEAALAAAEAAAERARERVALIDSSQAELNRALLDIEARLSGAAGQINLNGEKTERAKADIERVRGEIARAGERKTGRGEELSANKKKLGYLSGELLRYDGLLAKARAEYDAVLSALGESDRAIEALKQSAGEARDQYYNDGNRLSAMRAEREHFGRAAAAIERNAAAAVSDMDAGALAKEGLNDRRFELSKEMEALHAALKAASEERASLGAALDGKRRSAADTAMELNAKRSRMKILEGMESSYEGFYASVRRVLAECSRSPEFGAGICGAVASLIKAPKELETAIGMALGSAQQNIVTDDEGAAQRAIAFLKRSSGGRATFLPITSIRGRALGAPLRAQLDGQAGFVGVASELIGFDEKYANIVSELLGTTVVADKLDNGLAIASRFRRAFRVVTLDGDVVSISGAITGGSVEARDSGILGRRREIGELASVIAAAEKSAGEAEGELARMESALSALAAGVSDKERAYNELRMEGAALEQQIGHIDDKLKADAGRREMYKVELAESARAIGGLEQSIADLSKHMQSQSDAIDGMQAQIDAYTEKNREGQQNRDELLSDISAYNVSVASITEARRAVEENIARLDNEMAESDRGVASREAAIARYERDIEAYAEDMGALRAAVDRAEQEKRGAMLRIESAASEKASLHDEARGLAEEAARVNGLLTGIAREISRFETRAVRIKAELDHCRNRLWEDYELTYHNALASLTGAAVAGADVDDVDADVSDADDVDADASDAPDSLDADASEADDIDADDMDADADADAAAATTGARPAAPPPLMGEAAARRSAKIRDEMRALGPVNVLAIDEYAATKERHEIMEAQSQDLIEASGKLRRVIADMSEIMRENFVEQFNKINQNFDIVFKELFSGGRARLILSENAGDVLDAGIEIEIQLPGKRMQNMMLYSGGERALTAIALIFAMLMLKQPPFCLLDEIESALDEANIERFSHYINKYSGAIQFILITHRKGTMEGSDVLYGVTMQERGVSGVVSLRISDAS
ncbi:MAG: chromosome segregation protein SMC [Oscillospiraceae bacterium]|nr:chromosome segregation protein SMC [Oscillospiraceae bacterium]